MATPIPLDLPLKRQKTTTIPNADQRATITAVGDLVVDDSVDGPTVDDSVVDDCCW